jgi:alpha-L-fucosidase
MHREGIPREEYARLAERFQPQHFDADTWAATARAAGMRYVVMTPATTTALPCGTAWPQAAMTRYIPPQAAISWPNIWRPPAAPACTPDCTIRSSTGAIRLLPAHRAGGRRPAHEGLAYGQLRELTSLYGPLHELWYDGGWMAHSGSDADAAWFWEPLELNRAVRQRQPGAAINPRSGWAGNFAVEEGGAAVRGPVRPEPWEKALCLNPPAWGYTPKSTSCLWRRSSPT